MPDNRPQEGKPAAKNHETRVLSNQAIRQGPEYSFGQGSGEWAERRGAI